MIRFNRYFIAAITLLAFISLSSCVSSKKYEELQSEHRALKASKAKLEDKLAELEFQQAQLEKTKKELEDEKARLSSQREELERSLNGLTNLSQKNQSEYQKEVSALLKQIQEEKENLLKNEDELRERTAKLEKLEADFNASRERLVELEQMLAAKDAATNELRRKVADALLGFEGKGLTVTKKNGKVYVSLDEKLLFNSGSYAIESRGAEALRELAKVLEVNPDINIMVEGHTDDVPLRGSGEIKDNWDLSVKRATTVVRTLLQGSSVHPERIIAAGRSEYVPIDASKTSEGRQKNRRTEIILTPKLDELLEILGDN
ncbi:MAG: OmpA family protein [Prevotellaceae bacterium]|jgi:chemotaxis protein MotB|nr:OmpA family protein [Prevotellaceae bacterium]